MTLIETMLQELEQEADATRRVLARVPDDKLAWRPHPKARTLGQLALHVAMVPGGVAAFAAQSDVQAPNFTDPDPSSAAELVPALDESIALARRALGGLSDEAMAEEWRMLAGDRIIFSVPRGAFLRSTMLNHWYHHRGQLTVYLRALDIPVPWVYGPSADESPF